MILLAVSIFDTNGIDVTLLPILALTDLTGIVIAWKAWLAISSFFDRDSDGEDKVQPTLT